MWDGKTADHLSADRAMSRQHERIAFTVDVEEWFHARALNIPAAEWESHPSRLDPPIEFLLEQLDRTNTRATFFVLGWVAARRTDIVRRIASAGHEIASHGMNHYRVDELTLEQFARDVRESRKLLQDVTGQPVLGYRAPCYSLTSKHQHHLDALCEAGYEYDSSVYPTRTMLATYGDAASAIGPHNIRNGLWEFPLPTVHIGTKRWPVATGAYLRLFPWFYTKWGIEQNLQAGRPVVVNIHPWELDSNQPRRRVGLCTRIRHYAGTSTMKSKVARILGEYGGCALCDLLPTISEPVSMNNSSVACHVAQGEAAIGNDKLDGVITG